MKKIDTDRGYIRKPKPMEGYVIDSYYCECGCKKSYWRYVKEKPKRNHKR
jgi:hypothetical protein